MVEPDFEKGGGLVPVIVQDRKTKDVLMLAYMNRESWMKTLETGRATYWSRSRNALWEKGETSGHYQIVHEVFIDCDNDTVLIMVEQLGGAACHEGYASCFYRRLSGTQVQIVGERLFDPGDVYR
ncbi:MAG: phosphoribosyl-AMP cyclohydrolase [Deltaproteobacteria bacterium]|nr:phosphoribosyl-AMP cyclohydrolase [Deltaproteobacteria bacterium]